MEAIDNGGFDGGVRGDVRSGEEGTIEYPVDETKRRDTRKRENAQSRGPLTARSGIASARFPALALTGK